MCWPRSHRIKRTGSDAIGFFLILVRTIQIPVTFPGEIPDSCMQSRWLSVRSTRPTRSPIRSGFTLIELVIVVLILAILTTMGALRVVDTADSAKSNGARQSLAVLRQAIELHKLQTGAWPGDAGTGADLASDLAPYLKGQFPKLSIPGVPGNASVVYETDGNGLAAPDGSTDWHYDNADGSIAINGADHSGF